MSNRFTLPVLYKLSSKDKIRTWNVSVMNTGKNSEIHVQHGEENGKMQLKCTVVKSGKNIGKINETTHFEQAISEAKSKWAKQLDKGYSEIKPKPGQKPFRPMLAKVFKDHKHKVLYPCYVQPKLDGLRCTISLENGKAVARSRKNKEWKTIQHILDIIEPYLIQNPNFIMDGEIYCDPQVMSFQKICSAIKRDEANEKSILAKFFCYDMYDNNNPNLSYSARLKLIPEYYKSDFIKLETKKCNKESDVYELHDQFIKNGYEGTMVKNIAGKYKIDGRSEDLLKLKDFQDREYKIHDKKMDKNGECVFVCEDVKLKEYFDCKPEGTHEERVNYLNENNIGKILTVRFFEYTDKGLPRFPVGVSVRDYE